MPTAVSTATDPRQAPAPERGPTPGDAAPHLLRSYSRLARRPVAAAAACTVVGAVLMIVQYRLLAAAVDQAVFAHIPLDRLWPLLAPVLPVILARAILAWIAEAASVRAAGLVKERIRTDLLDRLLALGPVRLAGEGTGAFSAMLIDGVEALEPYFARFLPAMNAVVLVPLAVLAAVLPMDWPSALVLIATAPLIPLFMILIGRGAERLNRRQWSKLARMSAHFLEVVQGLTTLKLFNASRREAEVVERVAEDYRLATMSVLKVAFLSALALEFFATAGVAVVAVLIGFRLLWGDLGFERGFFVLLVAPEFYLPLRSMGAHYHARMEAIGAAAGMADLLARPVPSSPATTTVIPAVAPEVAFRGVRLVYGNGRVGLDGADFRLKAGTVTALVGPSGAGKSSIVNLLLGFVRPDAGVLLVDGRSLETMDVAAWRRSIGWVPQRPHLFRGSIADNIRLGDPQADDEALERAARLTGAWSFIAGLPEGLSSVVGEDGAGLSGGQRRLIALTRTALRAAPFLILDEPTASLDRASERRASEALRRLAEGRTVLVVAHRLETVERADSILVLDEGRVVEHGTHRQLVAADGLYAELVRDGAELMTVTEGA